MRKILLGLILGFALTASAFAHSPLKTTMPANGETVTGNPDMLHLVFAKPVRVTKIMLKHTNGNVSREEKLKLPSKEFGPELMLQPEFKGPGIYEVNWRALGKDGHALKGIFSFTVTAE